MRTTSHSPVSGCRVLPQRSWSLMTLARILTPLSTNSPGSDFGMLSQNYGPFCLDLFASPTTFLFKPFCSRFLCKESVAVDAFTIDWGNLNNGFFHPPVGLVTRVLKHAQFVKAKGSADRPCMGIS